MPTDADGVTTITSQEVQERFKDWVDGCYCGWGVGPGWQELLYTLCKHIEDTLNRYGVPKDMFVVAQVKEKFGGLRFYYEWKATDDVTMQNRIGLANEDVKEWTRSAEQKADATCEVCGKPGKLIRTGWWKVRCQECDETNKRTWSKQ